MVSRLAGVRAKLKQRFRYLIPMVVWTDCINSFAEGFTCVDSLDNTDERIRQSLRVTGSHNNS